MTNRYRTPFTRRHLMIAGVGLAVLGLAGCGGKAEQHSASGDRTGLRPYTSQRTGAIGAYPSYVTADIADAYDFAVERPDVLAVLPCYCGCGLTANHRSNLDCFIAGSSEDGTVVFDEHASYCQTCLDIARDARTLLAEGKSLSEIRATVDGRHRDKGPGTDTPGPA